MPPPSKFTPELGHQICHRLSLGESLRKICAEPDMPARETIHDWVLKHADFRADYEQSRLLWADATFERIAELSAEARALTEDAEKRGLNPAAIVGALREEIRGLMWVCARLRPDKYGDRIATEISGPNGTPLFDARQKQSDPELAAQAIMLLIEGAAPRQALSPPVVDLTDHRRISERLLAPNLSLAPSPDGGSVHPLPPPGSTPGIPGSPRPRKPR